MAKREAVHDLGIAYHEAGHAVINLCENRDLIFVELGGQGDVAGQCDSLNPLSGCRDRMEALDEAYPAIRASYAGLLAQRLVEPNPPDAVAEDDEAKVEELASELSISQNRLNELHGEAGALVKQWRPAIDAVARELLSKQKMTGREVYDIVRPLGIHHVEFEVSITFENASPSLNSPDGDCQT